MPMALAELFVDITAKTGPMDASLEATKGKLSGFSAAAGGVVGGLREKMAGLATSFAPVAAAAAATAGIVFFKNAITGASDLGETLSKVDVVFGSASGSVKTFAAGMAGQFGSSKQEILDAAAGFGLIGKAAGQSQPQAAAMSIQLAKLADDASSFYNVPLEDALLTIKSALVGESEPIRRFGVLLNEAAVASEAVAIGAATSTKAVSEQAKVMARQSLIIKGMKDATGDHERTQGSFSNQMRELTGRLTNLGVSLGQVVLPLFNGLLAVVNPVAAGIGKIAESVVGLRDRFADAQDAATGFFTKLIAPEALPGTTGTLRDLIVGEEQRRAARKRSEAPEDAAAAREEAAREKARAEIKKDQEAAAQQELVERLKIEEPIAARRRALQENAIKRQQSAFDPGAVFEQVDRDAALAANTVDRIKDGFAQAAALYDRIRAGGARTVLAGVDALDASGATARRQKEEAEARRRAGFQASFGGLSEGRDKVLAALSSTEKDEKVVEEQKETTKAINAFKTEAIAVWKGLGLGLG